MGCRNPTLPPIFITLLTPGHHLPVFVHAVIKFDAIMTLVTSGVERDITSGAFLKTMPPPAAFVMVTYCAQIWR